MRGRGQVLLCCALLVLLSSSALAAAPPPPPAGADVDSNPLVASPRLGLAAGQLRFWGAAGAAFEHGAQLALQGNVEFMTLAFVGIRCSMLALPVAPADGGSSSWS